MSVSLTLLKGLNSGVRFALELCALAALVYWGFKTSDNMALKLALGLGAPIAFAVVWGMFIAPKAVTRVKDPLRLFIEIIIFAAVTAALLGAGRPELALTFAGAVTINLVLIVALGQRTMV